MDTVLRFRERAKQKVILMDGAMGTYFGRLHPEMEEAEFANSEHPEWIIDIHKEYLEAGAEIIRTNTFAVNHALFSDSEVIDVLKKAVECAKCAVLEHENQSGKKKDVWIAGSIGPIPYSDDEEEEQVMMEYRRIGECLAGAGIRIFVLETFDDWRIVKRISDMLKEWSRQHREDIFVLAQFSVNRGGYTKAGYGMQSLVEQLEQMESVDAFGFNCGIGAAHMNQLLDKVSFQGECMVSALPNAGYDHMLRGRRIYIDHPDYYAATMGQLLRKGVNIAGGCCGTTPEHIKMLSEEIQKMDGIAKKKIRKAVLPDKEGVEYNPFVEKLQRGERVYVVEIDSPFNGKAEKFLQAGAALKENNVDLVTISDSPMARPRAEAFEMGIYLNNQTGVRVMPHVSCRDRNVIALRSAMLGGHINGIRDLLIITGDPVARDDRGAISAVFDFNSIKLMEYVKNMNTEVFPEEPFYYGGALNYAGVNIEAIAERMRKKMAAGCGYFLTQPVYSGEDIQRVRTLREMTGAKIILGIMPLVSYKNALFMKNEMPGIHVPDDVLCRYHPDMTREEAESVALHIAVEIGKQAMDFADGFYFMTPFHRVDLVNRIIKKLRRADEITGMSQ